MHDFLWLLIMVMHSGVNEGLTYQAALIHCAAAADVAGTVRTSTDDFRGSFSLLVSLIEATLKKGKKKPYGAKHSSCSVLFLMLQVI